MQLTDSKQQTNTKQTQMSATKKLRWWVYEDKECLPINEMTHTQLESILNEIPRCFWKKEMNGYKPNIYLNKDVEYGRIDMNEKFIDDYVGKYFVIFTATPYSKSKLSIYFEED